MASISSSAPGGLSPPRSLIAVSETITHLTPGWSSTSRSKRFRALSPDPFPTSMLPLIPALSTPTSRSSASSRRASWSGHRRLWLNVESNPSVIEAPSVTTAPSAAGLRTSTPDRKA
jgi:hypothetical protein